MTYEKTSVDGSFKGEIQGCAMTPIPDVPLDDPKAAMVPIYKARALVTIPTPSQIEHARIPETRRHRNVDLAL